MYYQQYLDSARRVRELVVPLDDEVLDRLTPACPDWSVRDIVAHLSGAAASFGTESFAGVGTDPWTRDHVESRRGLALLEVLAEREECAPRLLSLPADSPGWLPVVHDALTHEADIRGAIGAPQLPADVLAAAFGLIERTLPRQLSRLGNVEIVVDGQPMQLGDGAPELVVDTRMFEFWRGW
ncbi:MAG: maleylpyruvate isomerase family mycothiol-dependent enzyme, partial [Jatrophihabitantaceae bacterium]